MLTHLRQRVLTILRSSQEATLSTFGPAGIQAQVFPYELDDLRLFFLVPGTSDHLLNLEDSTAVLVSTPTWQLQGTAVVLPLSDAPPGLALVHTSGAAGCLLVSIRPQRLQLHRLKGWGFRETIDIDEMPAP